MAELCLKQCGVTRFCLSNGQRRLAMTTYLASRYCTASELSRPPFEAILSFIHPGDTLVVTRIDRLARDIGDLKKVVRALTDKGAGLQATEQPIDTTTSHGRMFLDLLGVFAELGTNSRRERQLEGIAKAKAKGIYAGKGRPRKVAAEQIRRLKAEGIGPTEIAKRLGTGRASVSRAYRAD